jgi:lipoyl(octanoyl) transferase
MHLGVIPYGQALAIMEKYHSIVAENEEHEGYLIVLQHPPTVTMGKRELLSDMKIAPEELKFKGIAYHKIDRGGSVTVHEPGQIVIYPIININKYKLTVRSYVNAIEQAMIETCQFYGVVANRDSINAGVWVGQNKIGAVGIRVLNKVTKHGLAFNVTNSMQTFSFIVPCGIRERGVTNLYSELKNKLVKQNSELFLTEVEMQLTHRVTALLKEKLT